MEPHFLTQVVDIYCLPIGDVPQGVQIFNKKLGHVAYKKKVLLV